MSLAILSDCTLASLQRRYPRAWTLLAHRARPDDITLAAFANTTGEELATLLFRLNEQAGLLPHYLPTLPPEERARLTDLHWRAKPEDEPAFAARLAAIPAAQLRPLDTRPLLARGEDPFQAILEALAALPEGGGLLLEVPFAPVPLYRALAERGFDHHVRRRQELWQVLITPAAGGVRREATPDLATPLDARGLAPPEPMLRILSLTPRLQPGDTLEVMLDRYPTLLYPRLAERGLTVETREEGEIVRLRIQRPVSP